MMGTMFEMVVGYRGQSYRDLRGDAMADALWSAMQLPAALFYQPDNVPAHNGGVRIGNIYGITIGENEGDPITAGGELFDGRPGMDRVQPWVMEAMALADSNAIWPSVDPAVMEVMDDGETARVVKADIPGVTLVSMPAFTGTSITLLGPAEVPEDTGNTDADELLGGDDHDDFPGDDNEVALIAAANATVREPLPADAFNEPALEGYQPGYRIEGGRIFGHVTNRAACHRSWASSCVTPPESPSHYAVANRYDVLTSEGPLEVGRFTTGLGTIGSGCTCHPGTVIDDHYCPGNRSAAAAIAHYDQLHTIADVMIGENEAGSVWIAGVLRDTLPEGAPRVLQRRVLSGDWRPWGTGSELIEVLALATQEPGFTHRTKHNASAYTLIAAAGPRQGDPARMFAAGIMSEEDLRASIRFELAREREAEQAAAARISLEGAAARSELSAIARN